MHTHTQLAHTLRCKYNYIDIQLSQDKHRLMRNAKLWLRCGQVNAATAADEDEHEPGMTRRGCHSSSSGDVVNASTFVATDVNVCIVEILIAFT